MNGCFTLQDSNNPESLVNMCVVSQHLGKAPEVSLREPCSYQILKKTILLIEI